MRLALCLALTFVSFIASPTYAQSWARQLFSETSHDFGTVARAAKTEHRFALENRLKQDIHISSVRASCGCTTPIVEDEWIKPGQVGHVLARFNTGTFLGDRGATLTVVIDRPSYAEIQLKVKGYIRSDVVFNPGEVNFGALAQAATKSTEVDLDYAGRGDWQVLSVKTTVPYLKAEKKEVSRSAGRVKYRLSVELTEEAPVGFLQSEIVLETNDRRLKSIPLRVSAEIQPVLAISPQTLDLKGIKKDEEIQKRLVVRSPNPFRIVEISSEAFDVKFEPTEEPKETHILPIVLRAKDIQGKGTSTIVVKTDLAGSQEVAVEVNYEIVAEEAKVAQNDEETK